MSSKRGAALLTTAWRSLQHRCNHLQFARGSSSSAASSSGTPNPADLSATNSKLFDKVPPIPPEAAAAAATAAAAAEAPPHEPSRLGTFISNAIFYSFLGSAAVAGYCQYRYDTDQLQVMVDETKQQPTDSRLPGSEVWTSLVQWYVDQRRYYEDKVKEFAEPPSDKLLPDLPPQLKFVKTLVLDLDDVLVHASWTRQRGWRSFKRPGVDEFIKHMAQYYELVLYTNQNSTYADPILDRIDPQRNISYRLYKNSTYYIDGKHVRDLSKLNRDLSRVLFVSANEEAYAMQPENTIKLKPWHMEENDTTLIDLVPFLEAIVRTNVPDVRDVVRSYDGLDIPTAFKERMQKVQQKQRTQQGAASFLSARRG